jgi:signal peptidase I
MNINLPLILTLAVFFTGLVWLLDAFIWSRPRKQRVAEVEQRFAGFLKEQEPDVSADARARETYAKTKQAYEKAREAAEKEPLLVEYSKSFFPVLLLVFVLRSFVAEPFQIPSGSMEPTLDIGDFILVNKFTYGIRLPVLNTKVISVNEPQRGDVMVFFPPHMPDTYFIKRVIGLPGDEVRYINHVLYINGERVPETLLAELPVGNPYYRQASETLGGKTFTTKKNQVPGEISGQPHRLYPGVWRVPEGHYFMMGDNRDNSADSRVWGMVPEDAIVGKAFVVWMHWDKFFSIPSFSRVGVIE